MCLKNARSNQEYVERLEQLIVTNRVQVDSHLPHPVSLDNHSYPANESFTGAFPTAAKAIPAAVSVRQARGSCGI
jgi:hypothetical protein